MKVKSDWILTDGVVSPAPLKKTVCRLIAFSRIERTKNIVCQALRHDTAALTKPGIRRNKCLTNLKVIGIKKRVGVGTFGIKRPFASIE